MTFDLCRITCFFPPNLVLPLISCDVPDFETSRQHFTEFFLSELFAVPSQNFSIRQGITLRMHKNPHQSAFCAVGLSAQAISRTY